MDTHLLKRSSHRKDLEALLVENPKSVQEGCQGDRLTAGERNP